jgi:hypothetical protein
MDDRSVAINTDLVTHFINLGVFREIYLHSREIITTKATMEQLSSFFPSIDKP